MEGGNWKGKVVAVESDKIITAGEFLPWSKLSLSASSSSPKKKNSGGGSSNSGEGRKRGRPRLDIFRPLTFVDLPLPLRRPPVIPPRKIDEMAIRYLFKKELKHSDVSQARRIVIPKMAAEEFLPNLYDKEGIFMSMDDKNGNQVWCFKFRFWPNNHSRMYVFEHTGEFIKAHDLTFGDYIYLYKDDQNERYVIEAQKCKPPGSTIENNLQVSLGPVVEEDMNDNNYYCNNGNFPFIDGMGMHYLDDSAITTTFDDFPTVFSGGSLPQMPTFDYSDFSFEGFP